MQFGFVCLTGRGANDRLLAVAADLALRRGVRLAGCVQANVERDGQADCDMELTILPAGPVLRINQRLGNDARGCRLDPAALETAVAAVAQTLDGADAVILNKFGKHEAMGRGFHPLLGQALDRDLPVLLGVNPLNRDAFLDFAGGLAQELAPDATTLAGFLAGKSGLP